ncbi:efflux RND transporter permease subunit [Desulfosarcina ovata]|uniref:Antibiotic transporter n=1 Tax=Desulfosarcina ovata subsp. ovata TaxID=2752305 RepID=A0A5K8A9B0_9BACT|nr:MMPL family transporter [Desulfosarcina ovata]BBO89059.1 antibiotic transporter [Desulfosarcina ovata subsp. ovata]
MKTLKTTLIDFSINHYRLATLVMVLFTVSMSLFFPWIQVDTDPENMIPKNDPQRVFHNLSKKEFMLSETVVVGVVNEHDPDGVFNPETLRHVHELTQFAKTLRWPDESNPGNVSGVIEVDMVGPSLVDHMHQGGPGEIRFEWLMSKPPETREAARTIRDKAYSNPMLKGRMFSEDGKVICIYLPLTDKHLSYRINEELSKKIDSLGGKETYHIAGVPVAEVAIGVEMFSQMGIGTPMAMAVIFALLGLFFRKWRLVILPMIIAMFSVLSTMGLMIALGFQVHILSSMIPIFLMCIGTVCAIHILSEFFDVYTDEKGRKETIRAVMDELYVPILYTSLTTAAGFASLVFAPIPPAQIFGAFLSTGVMIAWLYTVIFVPAYIMMIPKRKLINFGMSAMQKEKEGLLTKVLRATGRMTFNHPKGLLGVFVILLGVAIWGTTQIHVNDNYAKRFVDTHPIRKADIALNRHLEGTYTAYLILQSPKADSFTPDMIERFSSGLMKYAESIQTEFNNAPALARGIVRYASEQAGHIQSKKDFLDTMAKEVDRRAQTASDEDFYAYDELHTTIGVEKEKLKAFKRPEMLAYMAGLQKHMEATGLVGKTTSVVDVVRKINQEMIDGKPENYRIPDTLQGIAECYLQFQQGHRPGDLWHMVTPDFMQANLWMQLKSGDSSAMKSAVEAVDAYIEENPAPFNVTHRWAGLHYINLVLQEKLTPAMLRSFIGSFAVVFVMMVFLFRSLRWGLLCMVPLTITILTIYGIIGISGKDYDLPVAVLGVLALGMAVDFAIHFLQRGRVYHNTTGSWEQTNGHLFGEPARAISRNVLVIAIGFLPLLIGPIVPYKTMGIMLFAIMTLSGIVTLLVLPSTLTAFENWFFKKPETKAASTAVLDTSHK